MLDGPAPHGSGALTLRLPHHTPAGIWCSGRLSHRRPGVIPAMAGALPPLCGHCTIVSPKKLVLWRAAAPPVSFPEEHGAARRRRRALFFLTA